MTKSYGTPRNPEKRQKKPRCNSEVAAWRREIHDKPAVFVALDDLGVDTCNIRAGVWEGASIQKGCMALIALQQPMAIDGSS